MYWIAANSAVRMSCKIWTHPCAAYADRASWVAQDEARRTDSGEGGAAVALGVTSYVCHLFQRAGRRSFLHALDGLCSNVAGSSHEKRGECTRASGVRESTAYVAQGRGVGFKRTPRSAERWT